MTFFKKGYFILSCQMPSLPFWKWPDALYLSTTTANVAETTTDWAMLAIGGAAVLGFIALFNQIKISPLMLSK